MVHLEALTEVQATGLDDILNDGIAVRASLHAIEKLQGPFLSLVGQGEERAVVLVSDVSVASALVEFVQSHYTSEMSTIQGRLLAWFDGVTGLTDQERAD